MKLEKKLNTDITTKKNLIMLLKKLGGNVDEYHLKNSGGSKMTKKSKEELEIEAWKDHWKIIKPHIDAFEKAMKEAWETYYNTIKPHDEAIEKRIKEIEEMGK